MMEIDHGSPERPYVVLGSMPTADEWAEIKRNGYGIRLFSFPHPLETLLPYAAYFSHLNVIAGKTTNLEPIAQMTNLTSLFIAGVINETLDLSSLMRLSTFGADQAHRVTGVFDKPSLRHLFLTWSSHRWSPITAPIEQLTVRSAQRVGKLSDLDIRHPEELVELTVYDGKSLSVDELGKFVNLRRMAFISSRLSDISAILDLPQLEDLYLEDCQVIEPIESLRRLGDTNVTVIGRHPFDLDFVELALGGQLRSKWTFPPREVRRVSARLAGRE